MQDLEKKTIKNKLNIDPFYLTKSILLEMSNICNYSSIHPLCPVSQMKEKKILPLKIIEKFLNELKDLNYNKVIWPFCYSEPLIDPRFFLVSDMIKEKLPDSIIAIYSNGFFMNEVILQELEERKIAKIVFSVYTPDDFKRLTTLNEWRLKNNLKIRMRLAKRYPMPRRMNDKICWYDREPVKYDMICKAPYRYLTINSNGDVVICCHDYRALHKFGNIKTQHIKEILLSDKMIDTYISLINKERNKFYLCARCTKYR
jgi:radical SAM protein with 4Fe4S-binding SPASM domain